MTDHKANISDEVAETLFITLYARSQETRRSGGIIKDVEACRMVDAVDYDCSKFAKSRNTQVGVAIRTRHFDSVTRRFIEEHDKPVIVTLGCGLDTRSSRIGGDKGVFYNLDLPEVMDIRDALLQPDERNISLHESLFENAWIHRVREEQPEGKILIIAEGVLIYFVEKDVRRALGHITQKLSPQELLFDAGTSFVCKKSKKHETVKHTKAQFRWGLDDDRLPESWMPGFRLASVTYPLDQERRRFSLSYRLLFLFPKISRAFRILHYARTAQ